MFVRLRNCFRPFVAAVVVLLASHANAAEGVNLAWNHCLGEGTGVQNLGFACDTNAGSHAMSGSFISGRNLNAIIGLEIVVDLAAAAPTMPAWWSLKFAGSCRPSSLTANFTAEASDLVCQDWSAGAALGGIGIYCVANVACTGRPDANVARVKLVDAVTQESSQDLVAGVEYFAFHLVVDNAKTVGADNCTGCQTPVCIVLNSIDVVGKGNIGSRKLTVASAPGSNFITWQGGGVPVVGAAVGCPAVTASHRSNWGAVKSLYR